MTPAIAYSIAGVILFFTLCLSKKIPLTRVYRIKGTLILYYIVYWRFISICLSPFSFSTQSIRIVSPGFISSLTIFSPNSSSI